MSAKSHASAPLGFHYKYRNSPPSTLICCIRNEPYGHVCIAELDRDSQGSYGIDWVNPRRMATIAELDQIMAKLRELTTEELPT